MWLSERDCRARVRMGGCPGTSWVMHTAVKFTWLFCSLSDHSSFSAVCHGGTAWKESPLSCQCPLSPGGCCDQNTFHCHSALSSQASPWFIPQGSRQTGKSTNFSMKQSWVSILFLLLSSSVTVGNMLLLWASIFLIYKIETVISTYSVIGVRMK
jgi:hypothetical protein